jgi:hypothetical protein
MAGIRVWSICNKHSSTKKSMPVLRVHEPIRSGVEQFEFRETKSLLKRREFTAESLAHATVVVIFLKASVVRLSGEQFKQDGFNHIKIFFHER